jgi:hypothetical protein
VTLEELMIYFFISGGVPVPLCCPMRRLESCSNGSFVSPGGRIFWLRFRPADRFCFWLFRLFGPRFFEGMKGLRSFFFLAATLYVLTMRSLVRLDIGELALLILLSVQLFPGSAPMRYTCYFCSPL